MTVDLILNDLSLRSLASDGKEAGCALLHNLSRLIQEATAAGCAALRVPYDFASQAISEGYSILNYCTDNRVDEAERRLLLAASTRGPFIEAELEKCADAAEVYVRGERARGFELAILTGGLTVSLLSDNIWDADYITADAIVVGSESSNDGEIQFRHASKIEHIKTHRAWLEELNKPGEITNGSELWARREKLFPHLRFCAAANKHMDAIGNNKDLSTLFRILRLLDNESAVMQANRIPFNPRRLACNCTQESEATMNKYGDQRKMLCTDGRNVQFDWHAKHPCGWRIYLFPESNDRPLLIGYIGPHLDVATGS